MKMDPLQAYPMPESEDGVQEGDALENEVLPSQRNNKWLCMLKNETVMTDDIEWEWRIDVC